MWKNGISLCCCVGVVLCGKVFQQYLISWRLRQFLKLLGKSNNLWNHDGICKSNYHLCHQEDNPNGYPKSVSTDTRQGFSFPFWIWLILTHCRSFHWHFLACSLSPGLDFLSAASQQPHIPSATQRIKESCQHNSWPRKGVIHQCVYSLESTRSILSMVTKRI